MSAAQAFLDFAIYLSLAMLTAAFVLTVVRVVVGPTLPDRVLALDTLVAAAIGYIAVIGVKTGYSLYLDIAIALGLVGFLATVAFARFIMERGQSETDKAVATAADTKDEGKPVMTIIATYLAGILIIIGSFFALTAALGLIRLPDVYSRMHAGSKAGTMGSGLMMIALALVADDLGTATRAIAGLVFFLLTAPIAAHLLAKAAYSVGYRLWEKSVLDEMSEKH